MTKTELMSALEWAKDDAEIRIEIPHPALSGMAEVLSIDECVYRVNGPGHGFLILAKRTESTVRTDAPG